MAHEEKSETRWLGEGRRQPLQTEKWEKQERGWVKGGLMFLSQLHIKNFRGIQDVTLDFDEITVLFGSNNTGKTSILDALQTCLSRSLTRRAGVFSDYDYHFVAACHGQRSSQRSLARNPEDAFQLARQACRGGLGRLRRPDPRS